MHGAIPLLQKGIGHVLLRQFNQSNLGKDMEKLLNNGNNLLTLVKSTDAIMAGSVIKAVMKRADKLTAMTGKTIHPSITAQTEAQEEADQLNIINQLVIGAKEGVVKAITKLVGSNVSDAILRTDNSSNHKNIDELTLYKVMKVAIDGTDLPSMNNVLEQLIKVINHKNNFFKKVSVNKERLQSNMAQVTTYGVVIGIPQLMHTLLANIETATKSNYGHNFFSAMHTICLKYTFNHVYNMALLQIIFKDLVGAAGIRTSTGRRNHAFGCQISFLPASNAGWGHQLHVHQIGIWHEFGQQLV
jgi:hypothetical protein